MADVLLNDAGSRPGFQAATPENPYLRHAIFFIFCGVLAAGLWHFHDRFWACADDGAYAHVAQRILAGEVLNRDVQDIHPGYINFVNALALRCFGLDFVSLRYPLLAIALVQSAIVFWLTVERGTWLAVVTASSFTSLSVVLFFNPTAHWYCLFLVILIMGCLTWWPRPRRLCLCALGFLVMSMFLFRQLSGVITAMGVLAYLIVTESTPPTPLGRRWVARLLCSIMAVGLASYIITKAGVVALLLYGTWPLGLLVCAGTRTTASNRYVVGFLSWMAIGALAASAPLLAYHLHHGSLQLWLRDISVCAVSLTNLNFFEAFDYFTLCAAALHKAVTTGTSSAVMNGLFWFVLPLVGPVLGYVVLRSVYREALASPALAPVPFLAVFYSMTSLHFQIHIYLYYSVGLCIAALLWLSSGTPRRVCVALAVFLSCVALYYHAAQPLGRRILDGDRTALVRGHGLDRCSLWIAPRDAETYSRLVSFAERQCGAGDPILAIPFNPELYFLTQRRNPFRFFNTALGIHSDGDLQRALNTLTQDPPALVFHRPTDKYNTPYSFAIMDWIRTRYDLLDRPGDFEVYGLRRNHDAGGHDPGPAEGPLD